MVRVVITNSIRFVLLMATQVFLLKNIGYYNLSIPYLYILFILTLPFGIPNYLLFLLAFFTGLTIDFYYDSLGLNAAACTVLAFVRILFINLTVQRDGFDNEPEPSLGIMGFQWPCQSIFTVFVCRCFTGKIKRIKSYILCIWIGFPAEKLTSFKIII